MNTSNVEFWFLVVGGIGGGISWIIKTYTTFAKHVDVEKHLDELRGEIDNRFTAVQERTNKVLDELKADVKEQGTADITRVKEVHTRIDSILSENRKLILQIGELKGQMQK